MSQSTKSTRLRRSVAAFVAAAALVFGGSIAISPAYAVTSLIQVNDVHGAVNPGVEFLVHDVTSVLADVSLTTGPGGILDVSGLPDGDYQISPTALVVYDTSFPPTVHLVGGVADYDVLTLTLNARVYGSLPDDAGSGGTRIDLMYRDGVDWVSGTSWTVVNDAEGDFSLPLLNGPQVYTLFFTEEYSTPYLSSYYGQTEVGFDAANFVAGSVDSPVNLYDVELLEAGTIEGTVTRPDTAPVGGIDVHALSATEGTGTHTVSSDPTDGSYRIKVHAGFDYQVWIDPSPWVGQYFNNQPGASTATPVNPAPASIGVDFVLQTPPPDLEGNLIDSLLNQVEVETYLFKLDVTSGDFEPYGSTPLSDVYEYQDLDYGDYRLGFWDTTENEWMPWDAGHYVDLFLDTPLVPSVGEECYVSFDVDPGYGDITFDGVLRPGDYGHGLCKSPAADGDDAGTYSGHVVGYDHDTMGDVSVYLFVDDGTGGTIAGATVVDTNGDYSIEGVDRDGVYYALLTTENDQPWLDTWLGGYWYDAPGSEGDAYNAGLELTAYRDSSGHDISLLPATVFQGVLTADGSPLPSTEVTVWDPLGEGASTSSVLNGSYTVKVPAGGDYFVAVLGSWYYDQYWEYSPDEAGATVFTDSLQGITSDIDFDLVIRPGVIHGQLWAPTGPGTMDPINGITVHLFELQGFSWVEVDSQPSSGAGYYYFEVDAIGGDYRTRFSDASENWLGFTDYLVSNGPGGPFDPGSTCSFEFPHLYPGDNWFGDGLLDLTDFTTCGPELSVLSGRLVETQERSGGAPIANQYVEVFDLCGCTSYGTFTDPDGYFSFNGLPDGDYELSIEPREHTSGSGEHSYQFYGDDITLAGGAYLGEIELIRYGNVYGHIDNWDPAMTGANVLVAYDDGSYFWYPSSFIYVDVESNGDFDVPGVDVDGTYTVLFFFDDTAPYLDSILGGQYLYDLLDFDTVGSFTGDGEEDYFTVSMTIPSAQFITGVASYQPSPADPIVLVEDVYVLAVAEDFTYAMDAATDVNGEYSIKVAPELTYEVLAFPDDPTYLSMAWNGHLGCGCEYDPVIVGAASDPATTGIDFHLLTEDDVVVFNPYTSLFNGNDFEDVTVHLYQQVAGVWTETATNVTDVDGLTTLYGEDADDYRVSFSDGTTSLPIVDVEDFNSPGAIPLDSQCFFEFDDAAIGDYYEYDFHLNQTATAGVCGNPAAPPSSGGGSSVHHGGGSTVDSTSTPTPTPTATTDPDDGGDDGGSVPGRSTDDATDEPTTPAADFPWGGLLIVVVIVLCVGGAGFVILRRR